MDAPQAIDGLTIAVGLFQSSHCFLLRLGLTKTRLSAIMAYLQANSKNKMNWNKNNTNQVCLRADTKTYKETQDSIERD